MATTFIYQSTLSSLSMCLMRVARLTPSSVRMIPTPSYGVCLPASRAGNQDKSGHVDVYMIRSNRRCLRLLLNTRRVDAEVESVWSSGMHYGVRLLPPRGI